jgi:hypothetical protein
MCSRKPFTQERPNIFTQAVANIEPGKAIAVEIRYFQALAYHDRAYALGRLPQRSRLRQKSPRCCRFAPTRCAVDSGRGPAD